MCSVQSRIPLHSPASPAVLGEISDNCLLFVSEANRQLKMAVDEANAALGAGVTNRVSFAESKIRAGQCGVAARRIGLRDSRGPES
jgi:hypothetical protein